jgi:hypothetical protein
MQQAGPFTQRSHCSNQHRTRHSDTNGTHANTMLAKKWLATAWLQQKLLA